MNTGTQPGPFTVMAVPGGSLTLSWSGDPFHPFLLAAGFLNVGKVVSPLVGSFDIGSSCAQFSDVAILLDGFAPFGAVLFSTDTAGEASQTFTIPFTLRGVFTLQGLMGTTTGFPLRFTAATQVVIP